MPLTVLQNLLSRRLLQKSSLLKPCSNSGTIHDMKKSGGNLNSKKERSADDVVNDDGPLNHKLRQLVKL
jgi:hypothetical protein